MSLEELIQKGEEVKQLPYNSPLITVWENDVKAAVTPFGEHMVEVLEQALWSGVVSMSDAESQQQHREHVTRAQELLVELQKRDAKSSAAQAEILNHKKQEAKATLSSKLGIGTINGPVTFGDNSPANSLQVGEIMLAIISAAEETLPEGPEKSSILESLKSVTANPTFAALAGAALPEVLKQLFK